MAGKRVSGKVGLVGTGMVGASFAYALMQRGLANELVLVDLDTARAEGEAMDLNHGLSFVRPMKIYQGDYDALVDCSVVVVTAGANQRPGETRLDLLQKNAAVFRNLVPEIVRASPSAIIVIATNPVDILTHISAELAQLAPGHVIGSGTILDTARFRAILGAYYEVDPRSVHAYIIGEHGDSELPVWSQTNIGGVPLESFTGANGQGYDQATLDAIFQQTRTAAYEIIKRKKATYYAIGLGLLTIVEAVLRDQHTVLTVSTPLNGQYGLSSMSASLPSIVGANGVESVLTLPLSAAEEAALHASVQTLQNSLAQLK